MTHRRHEGDWLSTVLPTSLAAGHHLDGQNLEMHKRLVQLAELREAALNQLGKLDAVKVSLTEHKVVQQGRLLAVLDARLAAAHAAMEPHRSAVWDLVKALEKEAAFYSDVLQGLQAAPAPEQRAAATQRFQHLTQQHCNQQLAVQADELQKSLAAGLQPSQVAHAEEVEQLPAQHDSLTQQLRAAHAQLQQEHAARLQAERQQELACKELAMLQELAAQVMQQLGGGKAIHGGAAASGLQLTGGTSSSHESNSSNYARMQAGRNSLYAQQQQHGAQQQEPEGFIAQCQQLKLQLQQLSSAVAECAGSSISNLPSSNAAGAGSNRGCSNACSTQPLFIGGPVGGQQQQQPVRYEGLRDPWDDCCSMPADASHASAQLHGPEFAACDDPLQQLRQAFTSAAAGIGRQQQWQPQQDMCKGQSSGLDSLQQAQQVHVVRLRMAYQQMLSQVQARYKRSLQHSEQQHKQALQEQKQKHQEALASLTQQQQELGAKLAAASSREAEEQQQLARLAADNAALQQQIQKLQSEVSHAAASALAVVQVQHEQHLLSVQQQQQEAVAEAKQQVASLQHHVQQLLQEQARQAASLPSSEALAALVAEAAAAQQCSRADQHHQQQQQQIKGLRESLLQREAQYASLLGELAALKQLHEEPSSGSGASGSDADEAAACTAGDICAAAAASVGERRPDAGPCACTAKQCMAACGGSNSSKTDSAGGSSLEQQEQLLWQAASAAAGGCGVADVSSHGGRQDARSPLGGLLGITPASAVVDACDAAAAALSAGGGAPAPQQPQQRPQPQPQPAQQPFQQSFQQPQQQYATQQHAQGEGSEVVQCGQQRPQPAQYTQGPMLQHQRAERGADSKDAMGDLISAVLGHGPRAQAHMMLHQQRVMQQQDTPPKPASPGHASRLDKMLGLVPAAAGAAPPASPCTAAAAAAASNHCADQPTLVQKASSAGSLAQQCGAADGGCSSRTVGSGGSSSGGGGCGDRGPAASAAPPWRPSSASPCKASSERQQHEQQWQQRQQQQCQQLPLAQQRRGCGSSTNSPHCSPEKQRLQQLLAGELAQGAAAMPALVCVRCGLQEVQSPGVCCFHPGLVAAPGPLLYSQEWHMCRARCAPDMPGCYTRREHFLAPCAHVNTDTTSSSSSSISVNKGIGGGSRTASSRAKSPPQQQHHLQQRRRQAQQQEQQQLDGQALSPARGSGAVQGRQQRGPGSCSNSSSGRSRSVSPPGRPGASVSAADVCSVKASNSHASSGLGVTDGCIGGVVLAEPQPRSILPKPSMRKAYHR